MSDEDLDLPPRRTLVTGATGFLGAHVAQLLVRRGDVVRALVRPSSDVRALDGLELETVTGENIRVDSGRHIVGTTLQGRGGKS